MGWENESGEWVQTIITGKKKGPLLRGQKC